MGITYLVLILFVQILCTVLIYKKIKPPSECKFCKYPVMSCNFHELVQEPCKYAHMQVESIRKNISLDPNDTRTDHVHIFDKQSGEYVGVRAIGHPDIHSNRHKIVWPNGKEVPNGCFGVT